ncbi:MULTISPECIES: hypothetical protein [unclassified Sedimentibacter]|uniref:hypothetical protein n=1 Tax=unclassified Sedimentibacter TaxID=2649220 RepID=UPI0027DECFD2|nr:hypothetical protein [Sedimentibacter sp. MB35-C1]WMJ77477.1 hypothetical protein RBQ61_00680 [Sedimentibacter sp. MB35-C1]
MKILKSKLFKYLTICTIFIALIGTSIKIVFPQVLDFHLLKGTNENGQTYGLESEDSPDLIAAQGIDGTYGYILSNDLYGPEFSTPEEAVNWQEKHNGKRVIPLYASDGKTVIGEFKLEASGGIE